MQSLKAILNAKLFFLTFLLLCLNTPSITHSKESPPSHGISEVEELVHRGLEHYQEGEYEAAKEAFKELIELNPHWQVMLELRRRIEIGTFSGIITDITLREKPEDQQKVVETVREILHMMTEAQRRKMLDIENIEDILNDLKGDKHDEYMEARVALITHDRYSVPYLLEFLTKTGEEHQRLIARTLTTLRDIGRSGSRPLTAALQTENELLQKRLLTVLERVGDRKVLPRVLALAQDQDISPDLRSRAGEVIESIQARLRVPVELETATEEYIKLGLLYLHEDRNEVGHVLGGHTEIWGWDEKAEEMHQKMTLEFVPSYIYYQAQGAHLILERLKTEPANINLQGLLLALKSRELGHLMRYSSQGSDALQREYARERKEISSSSFSRLGHLYGPEALNEALLETLPTHDAEASVKIIKELGRKTADPAVIEESLCEALAYENADVRSESALAILRASPNAEICSPENVINVLNSVITEGDQVQMHKDHPELVFEIMEAVADETVCLKNYPIAELEPTFLALLEGNETGEELTSLFIRSLKKYGTEKAFMPLIALISQTDAAHSLRIQACEAIASIAERDTRITADKGAMQVLIGVLNEKERALHTQAAIALRKLGIEPETAYEITETEIRGGKTLSRAEILDIEVELEDETVEEDVEEVEEKEDEDDFFEF